MFLSVSNVYVCGCGCAAEEAFHEAWRLLEQEKKRRVQAEADLARLMQASGVTGDIAETPVASPTKVSETMW